jgi:hypothetical protein
MNGLDRANWVDRSWTYMSRMYRHWRLRLVADRLLQRSPLRVRELGGSGLLGDVPHLAGIRGREQEMGLIKRTPADAFFSNCVRERASWHCERCAKFYPEGHRQGLHCSHHIGRGNHATRYEPLNGFSLCYSCHQKMGADPHAHTEWARERLGENSYEILIEKKRQIVRKADRNLKEIAAHYREQLKLMETQRADGEAGRIEFIGFM